MRTKRTFTQNVSHNTTAKPLTLAFDNPGNTVTTFGYTGALDFGTYDGSDSTTIGQWLATGGGVVSGLDAAFADLQLSKPNINTGTATTTFFWFAIVLEEAASFTIMHDDGVGVYQDIDTFLGGYSDPTVVRTTEVDGFTGNDYLDLIYVATNGDPSVLKVDMSPVPLPASLPLLLVGLGGLTFLRRRARS